MTQTTDLFTYEAADTPGRAELTIDIGLQSAYSVAPWLYGKFCEHLGANIYHGMEAQILLNCTFARWRFSAGDNHPDGGVREESDREKIEQRIAWHAQRAAWPNSAPIQEAYFAGGAYGWFRVGSPEDVQLSPDVGPHGGRAQRVQVLRACRGTSNGIGQWTYLPLHRIRDYEYRIVARAIEPCTLELGMALADGHGSMARAALALGCDWQIITGHLHLPEDAPADALYRFCLTTDTAAHFVLDRVLLYPDDHVNGADPDVIRMLKDASLPLLRWPGGNFSSGYHWRDGVGPMDARPTVPNPAWEGLEFNLFGTDEFMSFCQAVGCEPLICVNAGDGTAREAAAWVEYCNGSADTPMGRLRAENGHPEPYGVRYWEIGNEVYGHWQVSWTTAAGNVDRYYRFRASMLDADPAIQLLGCGYGNEPGSDWNQYLIDHAGQTLRCLTDHILTGGGVDADTDPVQLYHAFMGYPAVLEQRYRALRDRMRTAGISAPHLAITELQLFAHFSGDEKPGGRLSPAILPRPDTISEALFHAVIVNACVRLGDFVELLTHSATVNHGGGLRKERERVYANPVHYAHLLGSVWAGGTPVSIRLACGTFSTQLAFAHIPSLQDIPVVDAMAALSEAGDLVLMLIHRSADCGSIELAVTLEGFQAQDRAAVVTLAGKTWHDRNTLDDPERITPHHAQVDVSEGNRLTLTLAPFSLTQVILKARQAERMSL